MTTSASTESSIDLTSNPSASAFFQLAPLGLSPIHTLTPESLKFNAWA